METRRIDSSDAHVPGDGRATSEKFRTPETPHQRVPTTAEKPSSNSRFERLTKGFRNFHFTPQQRVVGTRIALVCGFASGYLLSKKLWVSSRYYPLIPVIPGLHLARIPYPWDYVLSGVLFLLLVLSGVSRRPRIYLLGFSALLAFFIFFDVTRCQPWVYLYAFMFVGMACFSWRAYDVRGRDAALNICRLIVGSTYFYSGLQKINPNFAQIGVSSLAGAAADRVPMAHVLGWIVPFIEASIGLGLLTRRFRPWAVAGGLFMHLLILFTFGIVLDWNSVVWPWNLAMPAFIILLFWRSDVSFAEITWGPLLTQKLVVLLFGIMPFFSFFGWWDSDLSASLYSVNLPLANVLVSETVKIQLPPDIQKYVKDLPGNNHVLKIQDWSFGELNVPPYAAARAYNNIGAEICKYTNNSPDVVLLLQEKDTLLGRGRLTQDTCFGTLLVDKW
jgi:uncharacterized membrane protein YphA (DoxX/SURF4 family)